MSPEYNLLPYRHLQSLRSHNSAARQHFFRSDFSSTPEKIDYSTRKNQSVKKKIRKISGRAEFTAIRPEGSIKKYRMGKIMELIFRE
jgi:hypothetical protein